MRCLLDQLTGGDRRCVGPAAAVARQVLAEPERIDELFDGLADGDPVLAARSSDALEQVSAVRPDLFRPYKREILQHMLPRDDWIVRAHACQILPRLDNLTATERRRARKLVRSYLRDRSSVVKAVALECFVRLTAPADAGEQAETRTLVAQCADTGDTPALRARARKMQRLLAKLARAAQP